MANLQIIAEIGMSHEGSLGQAKQMAQSAKKCGVNSVKFQIHISEAETLKNAPCPPYFHGEDRYSYFERTAFSLGQWQELKNYCESLDLNFIASVFSVEAITLLRNLKVKTFKIPSGEVNNIPLLEEFLEGSQKLIISSGMSTWNELDACIDLLKQNEKNELVLLQCTSEYPCMAVHSGLHAIKKMQQRYQIPIGFSDHTLGIGVAISAVTLGASYLEKHFTLSKQMYGPDAKFSMEPHELEQLVNEVRQVELGLSAPFEKDEMTKKLKFMKETFEKSIVLKNNVKAGTKIERKHLAFKKPGIGIPSSDYKKILGKVLKQNLERNHMLTYIDLGK